MSAGVDEGARKSGAKLVMEVEVEGLSSVLKSVRELIKVTDAEDENQQQHQNGFFGVPELDALLPSPAPPFLELVSPPPTHHASGAGKTSLLYLIIAKALLPALSNTNIDTGCHEASILLFDPLHHFSVPRLIRVMHRLLTSLPAPATTTRADIATMIKQSLPHLHIFRPESWPSLLATLHTLPDYLFNSTRHKSMHRAVHSLILEDIDAFTWPIRAGTSFPADINTATTTPANDTPTDTNPLSTASAHLTTHLTSLSSLLSCATILTSHSTSPAIIRPTLPVVWPTGTSVTRLGVRRVEVGKFRAGISVEEAEAERGARWEVVRRGRAEVWRVGGRGDERFVLRVGEGVEVERASEAG